MQDKILRLRTFVQFDFYTVNELYCLQLFDKDVCANDGVDCIWEGSSKYFNSLFNEAIEWCKERG